MDTPLQIKQLNARATRGYNIGNTLFFPMVLFKDNSNWQATPHQ